MSSPLSELLAVEECASDSPYYRAKVREYEDYAGGLEASIQSLVKASKALQTASADYGAKSLDMVRRVSAISKLSPLKDTKLEQLLAGFTDVLGEIERNRAMQSEQLQQILVRPMEELLEGGLVSKIKTSRRRLDTLQADYEMQLTRLLAKKSSEPYLEQQERDVEAVKVRYISQMQTMSLDLNTLASVKRVELLESFLSLMYAQYANHHQAFSSFRDFEPTMRLMGEHIALARKEAQAEIDEASATLVVTPTSQQGAAAFDLDDADDGGGGGYVQIGQHDDDAATTGPYDSIRSIDTLDDLPANKKSDKHLSADSMSIASAAAGKSGNTGGRPHATAASSKPHRRSLASISLSPHGLFQISGYLFLRSQYSLMASWQRRWFEIKDGCLVHFQRDNEKDSESVPLHLCMVKRGGAYDRRNVFELIAPNRTYIMQAETSYDLSAWKACLKQAIEASLYSHTPVKHSVVSLMAAPLKVARSSSQPIATRSGSPVPPGEDGGGGTQVHASSSNQRTTNNIGLSSSIAASLGVDLGMQETRMAKMRYPQGNDRCVDCSKRAPEWAVINLGALVCIDCSGIHRSLGVHVSKVRSIKLDNWEPELMQIMLRLGNHRVNRIYESVEPKSDEPTKPAQECPRELKHPYVLQKYANRLYVDREDSDADAKLLCAARTADLPLALEALAQGANVSAHDERTGSTPLIEAVGMGDFGMLELLFLWGANANTRAQVTATSYIADPSRSSEHDESGANDAFSGGATAGMRVSGSTALHLATRLGNVRVVWYLVRKGAHWDTPDAYGFLPLDIALEDSNVQVVMALRYAAFQKASGLPPGTLGSQRQRPGANGAGGSAAEPVDILDVDDSFIRDWAIPPYSPFIDGHADGMEKVEELVGSEAVTEIAGPAVLVPANDVDDAGFEDLSLTN
ncbi:hypothetical protein H4R26_000354 [Coemansia thaxteri]|uniref:ArfGap-domain-containing protein n=1 Tax=Coemansia thaxteri TaxID=2663907 RepID=A0A9W8BKB2_9FUNG|nr:hypothetical protein H4R26_000354 [Coemansia thaxteri]